MFGTEGTSIVWVWVIVALVVGAVGGGGAVLWWAAGVLARIDDAITAGEYRQEW